jgi:hypothetical protein
MYNINIKTYKLINKIITENIEHYKKSYEKNKNIFDNYIKYTTSKLVNKVTNDNKFIVLSFLNNEIKKDIFENYQIDISNNIYNDYEILNKIYELDDGEFLNSSINKNNSDLIVSNLLDNFIKHKDKTIKEDEKIDSSDCEKYFLSKKYKSIDELNDDNNKLIYFDVIYDNTYYGLINEYNNEKENMDYNEFLKFLTNEIENKMNMTKEKALREAKAIIKEKKEVIDGDYCLLVDKINNKNIIFVRQNNIWTIDEKFKDNFYIDSNKIFCDSNKECLFEDEKCVNKSKILNKTMKQDVDEILKTFNIEYDISIEDIKKKLNTSYENANKYLINVLKIKKEKTYYINNILKKYNKILDDLKIVRSPYEKLRDNILNYPDFTKKQIFIKTFCLKLTRGSINEEDSNWLYYLKTSIKLMPKFLLKLANVFFSKGDYLLELDTICAKQGTISDDNNYWVDKHSGYIIKRIDFSSDEGYDEKGFKLNTKELIDDFNIFNNEKESTNNSITMIKYVINGITNNMNINLENHIEFIIQNVIKLINKTLPSKEQYEKLILKSAKKPKLFHLR